MRKIRRNESRLIFRSIGENLNQVTRDEEKRGGGEKKKKRRGGKRGSNLLEIPISVSCKTVKRKMRHRSRFITGTRTFSRQTKILPVLLWPGGREWEWWLMVVDPSPGNMSFPRGKYFIGGRKLAVRILQRIFLFLLLIHSPSVQFRSNFGHAPRVFPYYIIPFRYVIRNSIVFILETREQGGQLGTTSGRRSISRRVPRDFQPGRE